MDDTPYHCRRCDGVAGNEDCPSLNCRPIVVTGNVYYDVSCSSDKVGPENTRVGQSDNPILYIGSQLSVDR